MKRYDERIIGQPLYVVKKNGEFHKCKVHGFVYTKDGCALIPNKDFSGVDIFGTLSKKKALRVSKIRKKKAALDKKRYIRLKNLYMDKLGKINELNHLIGKKVLVKRCKGKFEEIEIEHLTVVWKKNGKHEYAFVNVPKWYHYNLVQGDIYLLKKEGKTWKFVESEGDLE